METSRHLHVLAALIAGESPRYSLSKGCVDPGTGLYSAESGKFSD